MKAMVFAAGLGTRLMPLTRTRPKALVEVQGKPLLQILLEKLIETGIQDVIINVHHHPDQILQFLEKKRNFGIHIAISDESGQLLDTGGGLKKAAWFFDDGQPFLVHNVDVISDLDLNDMLRFHMESRALATLAVRARKSSRYLLFDDTMQLGGWEDTRSGEKIITDPSARLRNFAFSGIHIIDPAFLGSLYGEGAFSIIRTYLDLADSSIIKGYLHNDTSWIDVGRPQDLRHADQGKGGGQAQ